jgi:hypothetical protein
MRLRHTAAPAPLVRERQRIESKLRPSARELFATLHERRLASRPVIGWVDEGKPSAKAIYGPPTFRNVIENGVHR